MTLNIPIIFQAPVKFMDQFLKTGVSGKEVDIEMRGIVKRLVFLFFWLKMIDIRQADYFVPDV